METLKEFVLDGSVTMAGYFKDEMNDYADAVRDGMDQSQAVVPSLWPLEVANTVVMGERRKGSTPAQAATWLSFLSVLPIVVDSETTARAWGDTLGLPARLPTAAEKRPRRERDLDMENPTD